MEVYGFIIVLIIITAAFIISAHEDLKNKGK